MLLFIKFNTKINQNSSSFLKRCVSLQHKLKKSTKQWSKKISL
nr:MAG TPA: hypothetical protein [Caudoviricetes sp.]DAV82805.1 MAG TPA: hypothetical protein [Caudoviricetes sp.]